MKTNKITNKITNKFLTLIIFSILLIPLFSSCRKKSPDKQVAVTIEEPVSMEKSSHSWYYFTQDNFNPVDKPQNAPGRQFLPWTETIRVSSASTNTDSQAFAVVNRLGILSFKGNQISLSQDKNIFQNRTGGNLVFSQNVPVFSVFKSSFFNDTISSQEYIEDISSHLFLVQFDPVAGISYPLINSNTFTEEINSEITDFNWDGENWYCAVKTISPEKNNFSYIKWKPNQNLLSISPKKAKENITISEISSETFRKAKEQIDYSEAPIRIKNLLEGFSDNVSFNLEVKTAGGPSPREYINKKENSSQQELQARGILSQSWSGVLFEDGTFFLEGALPGKHILRNGKPVAIRLPKLPAGFVYSEFTISDTTLYAAWEEKSFFKTARSGFIQVDLNESLYNKLL